MTISKKDSAMIDGLRAMNRKADEQIATLSSIPRPPKPVVLSAEQRRQRAAFHYERIALSRRDLSPNDVRALARQCVQAEVDADPMPELQSAAATAEEHLMKPENVRMGLNLKAELGTKGATDVLTRWIMRISEEDLPPENRNNQGAPLSALERVQVNVLVNQVGRNNLEKAQAAKLARDSMPAQVDVAGHAGRNLTERICSALKAQGYSRLPADQLVSLAARVRQEGRVVGA